MQPITRYDFVGHCQVWQLLFMCVLTLSLLSFREVQGQQQEGHFNNASLHGQYALVGAGGDHTAASIGIETYDGRGNVTRSLVLNELDADHKRKVVTITGQGTYQVQPNGMGATMIVNTLTHWTWRELDDASSRLALNLLNFGLQRGDRVASLMPNRDELLVLYLSCMKAGFIATPLNYRYQAPEIDHALEVSGARLLIAHAERDADLLDCQLLERLQLGVIQFQAADASGPTLDELIQRESAAIAIQRPEPNDPAIIFFTSGSTGRPKGVTHSFASVGWMLASAGDYTKLQSRSVRLRRIS